MPSMYQRLQFLEEANRTGRLNSLLFHADGPSSLLPALSDMIRLIEAASRIVNPAGHGSFADLEVALKPLVEDRP